MNVSRSVFRSFVLVAAWLVLSPATTALAQNDDGFKPIFDGTSLNGWAGDRQVWSVSDGALVAKLTDAQSHKNSSFLRWELGDVDDFELKLKFRIQGSGRANGGVQFRSRARDDGHVLGYQADIDGAGEFVGAIYDEGSTRRMLAPRGRTVTIDDAGQRSVVRSGDKKDLLSKIDLNGWNDYHIRALGDTLTVWINGHQMSQLIDQDNKHADHSGILALQLHESSTAKIEYKDLLLKRLPLANSHKKIVFIAGKKSHGWGAHEHRAGCLLLAKRLKQAAKKSGLPVVTTVYEGGWPADPTALDNADTIVAYCDGGEQHYLHEHGEAFEDIMRRGAGLVCLHYGVEIPMGMSGQRFLNWIGGYFEADWSVNPHWTAKFETLPQHPVTKGVQPFEIDDEWYYHMRFSPQMTRVTPILTALPPASTLERPDNPHHNNPHVREAVLKEKQPQHMAWAFVRGDGKGRGFGFTGGHWHANWKNDDFRKLVLNAIIWTAHVDVPDDGVASDQPTEAEMDANQDYPKPEQRAEQK